MLSWYAWHTNADMMSVFASLTVLQSPCQHLCVSKWVISWPQICKKSQQRNRRAMVVPEVRTLWSSPEL